MYYKYSGVRITKEFHFHDQRFLAGRKIGLYEKNNLIGFISYNHMDDGSADLLFLEVLEKYRGRGLGKELVEHFIEQTHPTQVQLFPENDNALQFFSHLVTTNILPKDTIIM